MKSQKAQTHCRREALPQHQHVPVPGMLLELAWGQPDLPGKGCLLLPVYSKKQSSLEARSCAVWSKALHWIICSALYVYSFHVYYRYNAHNPMPYFKFEVAPWKPELTKSDFLYHLWTMSPHYSLHNFRYPPFLSGYCYRSPASPFQCLPGCWFAHPHHASSFFPTSLNLHSILSSSIFHMALKLPFYDGDIDFLGRLQLKQTLMHTLKSEVSQKAIDILS